MTQLKSYKKFVINEQVVGDVNPTNIKTVEFSTLLSKFERLLKVPNLNDADQALLNSIRSEITSRYSKTGAKP
jgi:hypothetical protein